MKSINQIFKNNKHLMDEPEVIELINYCKNLEDSIVDYNQKLDQTVILKQIISEIRNDCRNLLDEDEKGIRWPKDFDRVDFKVAVNNLCDYINNYCKDNYIKL